MVAAEFAVENRSDRAELDIHRGLKRPHTPQEEQLPAAALSLTISTTSKARKSQPPGKLPLDPPSPRRLWRISFL